MISEPCSFVEMSNVCSQFLLDAAKNGHRIILGDIEIRHVDSYEDTCELEISAQCRQCNRWILHGHQWLDCGIPSLPSAPVVPKMVDGLYPHEHEAIALIKSTTGFHDPLDGMACDMPERGDTERKALALLLIIRDIADKKDNDNLEDGERLQAISELVYELFAEAIPAAKAEADIVLAKMAEASTARAISRSGTRSTQG